MENNIMSIDSQLKEEKKCSKNENNKWNFKAYDTIFAIVSLILGYLFIKTSIFSRIGLGSLIYVCLNIAVTIIYLRLSGKMLQRKSYIYPLLMLFFSVPFILSASNFIRCLCFSFVFFTYIYWVYTTGNNKNEFISENAARELVTALFKIPFGYFSALFHAIAKSIKNRKNYQVIINILAGLLITIIPTAIITFLLMSSDAIFEKLIDNVTSRFNENITINITQLLLSLPISLYIFGHLYGSINKGAESCTITDDKAHGIIPISMSAAAVIPILLVYLLFFITQIPYYLSAFTGMLPDGYSYSEYARRGFFELYRVTIINALLIFTITTFTKRNGNIITWLQKLLVILLSSVNLLIIATAISKMALYINSCGLTLKRLYTTWFMILTAVIFIFVIIKQFNIKFKFMLASAICFLIMFCLLAYYDVDGFVARDNADRCISGEITEFSDTNFYELEDSPEVIRQLIRVSDNACNDDVKNYARLLLHNKVSYYLDKSRVYIDEFLCYNISIAKTEAILSHCEFN